MWQVPPIARVRINRLVPLYKIGTTCKTRSGSHVTYGLTVRLHDESLDSALDAKFGRVYGEFVPALVTESRQSRSGRGVLAAAVQRRLRAARAQRAARATPRRAAPGRRAR